jgi:hypothetical protein
MKTITPNNLGKKYIVEECQKIRIDDLVRKTRKDLLENILQAQIEAEGFHIRLTKANLHHGGKRLWFECPLCKLKCGIIYKHPTTTQFGCRKCLNLEYRARRYKGMVENSL